jgi:sec-independent protein translocase protein TatC
MLKRVLRASRLALRALLPGSAKKRHVARADRDPEGRMSVIDHLRELRNRLIKIVIIIGLGSIVGYVFYDQILAFLKHPYCELPYQRRFPGLKSQECTLAFTGPLDGFTTRLKVSVIAGAILVAPFWLYQVWAYVTPGLHKHERRYAITFVSVATVLFAGGMSLAYVTLQKGLDVLIGSAGSGVQALLTINSYLSFVTLMLLVFGAAFELPLLIVMMNRVGVLPYALLQRSQRVAIFLIFVFTAVATPSGDPFTMTALAVPMCVLFEVAVVFAKVHDSRKAKRIAREHAEDHLEDNIPSRIEAVAPALTPAAGGPDDSNGADTGWSGAT